MSDDATVRNMFQSIDYDIIIVPVSNADDGNVGRGDELASLASFFPLLYFKFTLLNYLRSEN